MSQCGALVYVLDAQQSDYESPLKKLRELIKQINEVKPNLNYEVFIHKVDTDIFQTNDQKEECLIAV
jgi:Ras-related GTP-binding protein C/D